VFLQNYQLLRPLIVIFEQQLVGAYPALKYKFVLAPTLSINCIACQEFFEKYISNNTANA
jgi:hypothetical protein